MAASLRSFCTLSRIFQNLPNKCASPLTQVINDKYAVLKGSTDLNVTSQLCRTMTKWHKFSLGKHKPLVIEEPAEVLDYEENKKLVARVSEQITSPEIGRLFAVVYIRGLQRKVTTEDMLIVTGSFPPNIGDRLRLEKVLLVGSKDFSLVGRPILSRNVVRVEATVIEKTLSHAKVQLSYTARRHNRKFKLLKDLQTVLVINSIEVNPNGLSSDTISVA